MKINDYIVKYRNVDEKDYRGTPLEEHYQDGIRRFTRTPPVICEDGFKMSVQASETHYCEPKGFADEYTEVEDGETMDKVKGQDYFLCILICC